MPPMAKATPRPAAAACAIFERSARRCGFFDISCEVRTIHVPELKQRQIALPLFFTIHEAKNYFRLLIAVKSAENSTIPAAPRQFDPAAPGLIGVKSVVAGSIEGAGDGVAMF
jgi:hypothetical protein